MIGTDYIDFIITRDQAEHIAKHFGRNIEEMDEVDISELLDDVIGNLDY